MIKELSILYQDKYLVAINKPHGLLVHRSRIATDAEEFALQILRDQIGEKVYPAHRLDRKTSGVLLFAKDETTNSTLQELFRESKMHKTYWAIVRGFMDEEGDIDYALNNGKQDQEARTSYRCLEHFEIDLPFGKHPTSRYSLVELTPDTGRFHQLRKHMAHLRHPIIGDRPHGCNKQNKLWKTHFDMTTMMLHAKHLSFEFQDNSISLEAELSPAFRQVLQMLKQMNNETKK